MARLTKNKKVPTRGKRIGEKSEGKRCSNCKVRETHKWYNCRAGPDKLLCSACHISARHNGGRVREPNAKKRRQLADELRRKTRAKRRAEMEARGDMEEIDCDNCHTTETREWRYNIGGCERVCKNCHSYYEKHEKHRPPELEKLREVKPRMAGMRKARTKKVVDQNEEEEQSAQCKNCKADKALKWVWNGSDGYNWFCRNCRHFYEKNKKHRPMKWEKQRIAKLHKTTKNGKKLPESDEESEEDCEEEPASREPRRKKMRAADSSSNDGEESESDSSVGNLSVRDSVAHSDDVGEASEDPRCIDGEESDSDSSQVSDSAGDSDDDREPAREDSEEAEDKENEQQEEIAKEAEDALMVEDNVEFEADHGFEADQIFDDVANDPEPNRDEMVNDPDVVQMGNQVLDEVADELELVEQEENAEEAEDALMVEDEVFEMNPGFEADQILDEVVDEPVVVQGAAQLVADEDDDVICIGTVAAPKSISAVEKDGQLLVVRPNRLTPSQAETLFRKISRQ